MRTTLDLREDLLKNAQKFSKIKGKTAVIHHALEELISKHVRKRLIELGGTEKNIKPIRRRRT